MGTDASTAAPLSLQECKVRASILLKDLDAPEAARAARAAERLRVLPGFAGLSLGEVLARKDTVRRKHALAVIAREQGHATWVELKAAREGEAGPPRVDFEHLLSRVGGAHLNRWFTSYAEAAASLRTEGGFLFPYREQFFVCEASLLEALGADPTDADWARMGRDWLAPRDAEAWSRLAAKLSLLTASHASTSPAVSETRSSMSTDESAQTPGRTSRRSELKRSYKEAPPPMGVYAVRCLANGKVLVGASANVQGMLNRIRFELTTGMDRLPTLLEDWRRYGEAQFTFEVLDVLKPSEEPGVDAKEELAVLEALWLDRLKPFGESGYNMQGA
ncbi:LuxR family transcriptional regulator [Myxococcus hansupus]|uniref:LuxR family transcriptional regulator n=1 Tax=Pseudomyxococcus hansupus TaxID=1297742 RepID=A0A0H4X065_9BACT|nr:GIY-YIG nuclease family protein [Myxococcus hansupus]AKQ69091.1 LuxR family transcriptional regulator [Myxococcus hansupus]